MAHDDERRPTTPCSFPDQAICNAPVMPGECGASSNHQRQRLLDRPPEPVIGPAKGRTRWRAMTAECADAANHRPSCPAHSRPKDGVASLAYGRGIQSLKRLDRPPELVIRPAKGRTGWRAMTPRM